VSNSSHATAALSFGIFTNRKISTKILIGFVIVLALTAVISAMSYLGFGKVSTGFDTFRQRVTAVGIVRDVDREFVALRRYVREFSLSGDETLIEPAQKQRMMVTAKIGEGLKEIKNPERHKKMADLGGQFEKYSKDFDKLIALKQEQNKLTKEVIDPLGMKSRREIEELQAMAVGKAGNANNMILAGEALKQLLLARLNVNKLLGRHEQSSAEGAEKPSPISRLP